jgi:hypothetical protein
MPKVLCPLCGGGLKLVPARPEQAELKHAVGSRTAWGDVRDAALLREAQGEGEEH